MTDIFMDGFDQYGTGAASLVRMRQISNYLVATNGGYNSPNASCTTPSWGSAPTGPYCFATTYDSNAPGSTWGLKYNFTAGSYPTTVFFSFRFALDALPASGAITIFEVVSSTSQKMGYVQVTPTGVMNFYDGNNSLVISSVTPVFTAKQFYFLELQLNTTTFTFQIRINDPYATNPPALSGTYLNVYTAIGGLWFLDISNFIMSGINMYIDDLYIRDGSGTINNSWMGDRKVLWVPMTKDTTSETWTPPTNETFAIANMPSDAVTISAIQLSQPFWTNTGTASEKGTFIGPLKASTDGVSHTLSTTQTTRFDIFNLDPDTTLALTPASLLRCGFKITFS